VVLAVAGLEDVSLPEAVIAEAHRLDRELSDNIRARIDRINAFFAPPEPKRTSIPEAASGIVTLAKPGGKRVKIFGQSITAIIRWMGSKEWEYEDALRVLRHFGVDVVKVTITSQLHIGKNGLTRLGEPAKLTADQVKELINIVTQETAIEKPVAAKSETKSIPIKTAPTTNNKRKGQKILGHSATAVVRWMGTKEWGIDQVNHVLKAFDISLSPITIKVNLTSGAGTGIFRGEPAKLSPNEIKELLSL
jgi:hypothetical protein